MWFWFLCNAMQLILFYNCDGLLVYKNKMEGDEMVCRFNTVDMVGVIKQRFVNTEVSAIVHDHPSIQNTSDGVHNAYYWTTHQCTFPYIDLYCKKVVDIKLLKPPWGDRYMGSMKIYVFEVWTTNWKLLLSKKGKRLQSTVGYPKHVIGMPFWVATCIYCKVAS